MSTLRRLDTRLAALIAGSLVLTACRSTPGLVDGSRNGICPAGGSLIVRNEGAMAEVFSILAGGAREPLGFAGPGRTTLTFDSRVIRFMSARDNSPMPLRYEHRCNP